jgi:hypothetical protein
MEKIKQLNEFCSQAVVLLSDNIQRATVHENMTRVIPDVMMDALVDIMDVILQLNHLHDTKSSLRNDFSVFKRLVLCLIVVCYVAGVTCWVPWAGSSFISSILFQMQTS